MSEAKFSGSGVVKITANVISEQLKVNKPGVNASVPGILVVYSPGCIHCMNMEAAFLQASQAAGAKAHFLSLNGKNAANRNLIRRLGVTSFPTILKVKNGFITGQKFTSERTAENLYKFAMKR